MTNQINFFYNEFNYYIDFNNKQLIIKKYQNLYLLIRRKHFKTREERIFLKKYRNIDKYINGSNNDFIDENVNNILFDNINGYKLDYNQRKAILIDEINTLVIAGAGCGKSLTIIGKIYYLIEVMKIDPQEILCISFTNDSCNSLKKKLKYNVEVLTFHKLALKIIKKNKYIISNISLDYFVNEYFASLILNRIHIIKIVLKICGDKKMDINNYKKYLASDNLNSLKKTIISFINMFKACNYSYDYFLKLKRRKNCDLLYLIIDIYYLYQKELISQREIDSNDMISIAIKEVSKGHIRLKYKYFIIDEFQDTSLTRYLLIKEIIKNNGAKLFVVGDDWQSIYSFTGCNVDIFLNFEKYFGYTKRIYITNTYRNSQELINLAGHFIMHNKKQLKKFLKSSKSITKPVKIIYEKNNILEKLIVYLYRNNVQDIMILGRNNNDIYKYLNNLLILKDSYITYKNIDDLSIRYLTVHKSKGLEAECVIVLNLADSIMGFPNKRINHELINELKKFKEKKFDEERRLFYVALTRTKNDVYLVIPRQKYSIFVKEIIKKWYKYIEFLSF